MRKKKAPWPRKTVAIAFRITESEYSDLKNRCGTAQSVHAYARSRALQKRRLSRRRVEMIGSLTAALKRFEGRTTNQIDTGDIPFRNDSIREDFENGLAALRTAREQLMRGLVEDFSDPLEPADSDNPYR